MEELKNLNKICTSRKRGIYKQWIYKKEDFMKVCDYMQKINYSIQDLNNLKNDLTTFHPKNVIYSIVLVDWIVEAFYKIYNSINNQIIEKFVYSDEELFIKSGNIKVHKGLIFALESIAFEKISKGQVKKEDVLNILQNSRKSFNNETLIQTFISLTRRYFTK